MQKMRPPLGPSSNSSITLCRPSAEQGGERRAGRRRDLKRHEFPDINGTFVWQLIVGEV
jgi:hypothetical protein